ncbi:MAG: hypothetical protein FJ363_03095 [Gemmatimonadetes bacterium]|nr:hypothetical protein [Gemmatimonadota bacterium]
MRANGFSRLSVTALVALMSAQAAFAQGLDARWQPWIGCWTAAASATTEARGSLVCLVPAEQGSGVELAVIAGGVVAHRERFDASVPRVPKDFDGCPGWESVTFSRDARQVLFRSEFTCGATRVQGSGIYSVTVDGEWIDVSGSVVGGQPTVRAVRYRPAGRALRRLATGVSSDSMPFEVVAERSTSRYARLGAALPVRTSEVVEAAERVAPPVIEAWMHELQQGFEVNGRELERLADAGLPSSTIDLMVALSYPERFSVQRPAQRGGAVDIERVDVTDDERLRRSRYCGFGYAPGYPSYYSDRCYNDYLLPGGHWYDPFGLNRYGYGGYTGYGYGYGGYYGGYYWGPRPIVIVPANPGDNTQARGRAVKGGGYTRGSGGYSKPSSGTSGSSASGGSSSGGSSSSGKASSGGSSSGSSGGSSGRTAKPRPPG